MIDDLATLKHVPLFCCMDDDEIAAIRAIMGALTYAPGQIILREGERGEYFHVVVHGQVEFLVQNADGRKVILDTVGSGGFFGELSMLSGEPGAARVRAIDQVTTLALDRAAFFAFLDRQPHAAIEVLTVLAQRLHRTDTLLQQSVSRNINELMDQELTIGQRVADLIAAFSGSMPFLIFNAIFFAVWLIWNQPWFPVRDFDPFPFGLLTMIVSLEAIFLSIFVLVSQNRQATKDRLAAEVDHQVNTKAEVEIGLVLRRLDDLERRLPGPRQARDA